MKKKIYLIDGNSFIYRMFFGLPEFSTKDGKVVNAVFGVAKFFVGQLVRENPDYIVFIKDARGKNFRHDLYEDYKATRDRMPDNLKSQISDIEKMIELMNVEIIAIPGYEADDVIGTLASQFNGDERYEVDILTGDKDLYALVSENVKIYDTMKKKRFGPEETKEKFGIPPKYITDYLAIVGDSSDNIPGIAGFGPGKAVPLLNAIGGVETIYKMVEKIESGTEVAELLGELDDEDQKAIQSCFKGKTYEKLVAGKEDAFLSKKLATLDNGVELENFDLETFKFKSEELESGQVLDFFRELEFFSLAGEEEKKLQTWEDTGLKVQIIGDTQGLNDLEKIMQAHKEIVLDTETTSLNIIEAQLVGVSVYLDDQHIYYINRMHQGAQVDDDALKDFLNFVLNMDTTLVGHNIKYDLEIIELFLASDASEKVEAPQMSLGL